MWCDFFLISLLTFNQAVKGMGMGMWEGFGYVIDFLYLCTEMVFTG